MLLLLPETTPFSADILHQCVDLIEEYWNETPVYKHIPFSRKDTEQFIINMMEGEEELVVGQMEEGRMVGALLATSSSTFFNAKAIVIENILTYVSKKARGKLYGKKLIKMQNKWGEWLGAVHSHISTISAVDSDRTTRLYALLGYDIVGSTASMPLRGGSHE
jgi:hypothetical protein